MFLVLPVMTNLVLICENQTVIFFSEAHLSHRSSKQTINLYIKY